MKYIYTLVFSICSLWSMSQIVANDSVSTSASNVQDVFYSFSTGVVKSETNQNWDLAFEITGFTATILANHANGVVVWQSKYDQSAWATFDTSGYKSWKALYNSEKSWLSGAFNLHTDRNFDLGWGVYDPATRKITGDSIYLVKLKSGEFKKIKFESLTNGIYTFTYANLDGSMEQVGTVNKTNFTNKNFGYYNLSTNATVDREPVTSSWDILFTKYNALVTVPFTANYNVSGVWTNFKTKTATAKRRLNTIEDFSNLTFSDLHGNIGYNWKRFDMALNKYIIEDSLAYFVRLNNTQVWKIVFTNYKGGAEGKYFFNKKLVGNLGVKQALNQQNLLIYPNPTNENIVTIKNINSGYAIVQNQMGEIVSEQNFTNYNIDLSEIKPGVYIINVVSDHINYTQRLIIF